MPRSRHDLTDRQRRFIEEYLKDCNAQAAAIRAGYARRSAKQTGYDLLMNAKVAAALQTRMVSRSRRVALEAEQVLEQIKHVVLADPRRIIDPKTQRMLPLQEIDDATAAAISGYKVDRHGVVTITFWSKPEMVEKAMKHLGLYERDHKQANEGVADLLAQIHGANPRLRVHGAPAREDGGEDAAED